LAKPIYSIEFACDCTQICDLKFGLLRESGLPKNLQMFSCSYTKITRLPKLPKTLKHLWIDNTQINVLPKLPKTLESLCCKNTSLKIQRNADEHIDNYSKRWDDWRAEQAYIVRCNEKCGEIRDELIDIVEFATFCGEFFLE